MAPSERPTRTTKIQKSICPYFSGMFLVSFVGVCYEKIYSTNSSALYEPTTTSGLVFLRTSAAHDRRHHRTFRWRPGVIHRENHGRMGKWDKNRHFSGYTLVNVYIANWKIHHFDIFSIGINYYRWGTLWWTNSLQWKITMLLMGKSTISMAIFHCFLYVHQRVNPIKIPLNPIKPPFSYGFPMFFLWC